MSPKIAGIWNGEPIYIRETPTGPSLKIGAATTTVDPQGLVVARFAQLNVIDADGDVTLSGAIGSGQDVVVSGWQHGSWQPGLGSLPVGKGRVTEEGAWLVLRGRFFMTTHHGQETFATLKGLGERCEWSYGYRIAEGGADLGTFAGQRVRFLRKLLITEVSPVLRGAGIGTATVELSGLDPRQIMVANAARDNERALAELRGWVHPGRKLVGEFEGRPVYAVRGSGGRK